MLITQEMRASLEPVIMNENTALWRVIGEERHICLRLVKMPRYKGRAKSFIPCPWSLFKVIKRLAKTTYIVKMMRMK